MIPTTETEEFRHFRKRDDVATLISGGIGIELGVAEGVFSERILQRSKLDFLYSVDRYAGDLEHDTAQYKRALKRLHRFKTRNTILRLQFDEALSLFPDQHFDFIYVDGYAHTGEEGGQTFDDWWPKLKPGGIFAGDDYDPDRWPQVTVSVDLFVEQHGLDAYVIPFTEVGSIWSEFPTWFVRKPL